MATLNLSKMKYMSEANLKKFASLIISLSSQVTDVENKCIKPYVGGELYQKDSYVSYNGYIYQATATNQDSAFDETHWDKLSDDFNELTVADIEAMLGLSSEQLETMANLIADTEVRLDKTYSSSKIYQDIQQCLNDSKAFTLLELGKKIGTSYKIATTTGDMIDKEYIYLMDNGSTYDIYIVEEGTNNPVKIGDTNVNLSNYYTKTEIEADYLKKADADGKFATIDTVDNHISDTVAHMTQDEKDKLVTTDDIVTTIDSSSTLTQIPNAKGLYGLIGGNNVITDLDTFKGQTIKIGRGTGWNNECVNVPDDVSCAFDVIYIPYSITGSYGTQILTLVQSTSGLYKTYIRSIDNGTWGKWQRVCTTTVADVPKTRIIPTNTTDFSVSGNAYYTVLNGVCHVCLWGIIITNQAYNVKTSVVLPKPLFSGAGTFLTGSGTGTPSGFAYVEPHDSTLAFDNAMTNQHLFGSFSYPVAE